MTSVRRALKFPHHIQIFVQSVDPAITVFDQNIRRSLFAPEVADTDAIRVDPFNIQIMNKPASEDEEAVGVNE